MHEQPRWNPCRKRKLSRTSWADGRERRQRHRCGLRQGCFGERAKLSGLTLGASYLSFYVEGEGVGRPMGEIAIAWGIDL